jgi:hypothetical protein
MTVVAGATLCLGQLLHDQPDRDDAHATDLVTEDLLRMLGVPADEALRICRRPLPDPDDPDHQGREHELRSELIGSSEQGLGHLPEGAGSPWADREGLGVPR